MTTTADRVRTFRALHERGCFVIPNPWDIGSARLLAQLGFPAVASTSSGFAWSRGKADNHISLEEALVHFRELSASVPVPVNADFEGGFATHPDGVRANVTLACRTGVSGLSIEDGTGDPVRPLFERELAVERVRAARAAIDDSGSGVVLTARTEGFVAGRPDLDETIVRLRAFSDAGADCLFAPGLPTLAAIRAVVAAVEPRPVNVLMTSGIASRSELAGAGVRRISVGGALARAAWTGFLAAAREIAGTGSFASLAGGVTGAELNRAFGDG